MLSENVKEARHRRSYIMWFHLHEIPRIGKSIETENKFMLPKNREQLLNECRVSENSGNGCVTLYTSEGWILWYMNHISMKKKKTYIKRSATLFTTMIDMWDAYFSAHISKSHYSLYIPHFNFYFLNKPCNTEHILPIYFLNVFSGDISAAFLVLDFASSDKCHPYPPLTLKTALVCLFVCGLVSNSVGVRGKDGVIYLWYQCLC